MVSPYCPCSVSPSLCQHGSESPLWMFQHPCHLMQLSQVSQDRWLHPKQINSFWGATQRGFIFPGCACKHTAAQRGDCWAHQGENTPCKVSPHIPRDAERKSRRSSEKLIPAHGVGIRLNGIYLSVLIYPPGSRGIRHRWLTWWDP